MRVLNWEDIERMRRYQRELMKRELTKVPRPRRRRPRPKEEVLKLAALAAEAFKARFEVVECVECREKRRVLRRLLREFPSIASKALGMGDDTKGVRLFGRMAKHEARVSRAG